MIHESISQAMARIDKWLWAARFFKTRTLATEAVDKGRVRLDGERTKPAHALKPGDLVLIDNGTTTWEVTVRAIAEVRGSATAAQLLYVETPESVTRRASEAMQHKLYREPGTTLKGRPTKRDRRLLDSNTG
jgi:ribosome-associated heat shock protein Hsp15